MTSTTVRGGPVVKHRTLQGDLQGHASSLPSQVVPRTPSMFIRQSSEKRISRGQAMVEFALILPLLALLLVMAIDVGRVFFTSVSLNNSSRVAANYAAANPSGPWGAGSDYEKAVRRDAARLGCSLPTPIPAPTFPGGTALGAEARVRLSCSFSLITPVASDILGGSVALSAASSFPVRYAPLTAAPPPPPPPSCFIVPDLVGQTVAAARVTWSQVFPAGFFVPATGNDGDIVQLQVTSPVSLPGDCLAANTTVSVSSDAPPPPPTPTCRVVPQLVGLTGAASRAEWTARGFDVAKFTPTGNDTASVLTQTTTPASVPGDCIEATASVTVTFGVPPPPPTCTVPGFSGTPANDALGIWRASGFSGSLTISRPPNGNYKVKNQSIVGGQKVPCNSSITVSG